nr:TraU family protein [Thorsellia anophelis]
MSLLLSILSIYGVLFTPTAMSEVNLTCHDAKVFSNKLLTDICWSCLFPIKIAGINLTGGNAPKGASDRSVCLCDDALGLPTPGLVTSMWEPARLIELVRKPGCSPTLGGITLPLGQYRQQGTHGEGTYDAGDLAFYHYHYYAFPLMVMLDMFMDGHCNKEGYLSFDLMYASELDPTWQNDELAFFTQPEAASVAYPETITACMSDAIAASSGEPIDALFWCVGSWGHLYPLSGHTLAMGSIAENTSHLAARAIAASHRRGLARRTMGNDALCGPVIEPMMIKSQYKMSMFYPVPESQSSHAIGQSSLTWGEWRTIPGAGEDAVYLIWRWQDCCNTVGG